MNGRLFGSATAAILLFTCSTISSSAERESMCQEILLHGSLRAGEHFSTKIGNGLELRLLPMRFSDPSTATPLDGWRIQLVPTEAAGSVQEGGDRISPVNLPLRFNPWQDIGSSYGMTAEQSSNAQFSILSCLMMRVSGELAASLPMLCGLTPREIRHTRPKNISVC